MRILRFFITSLLLAVSLSFVQAADIFADLKDPVPSGGKVVMEEDSLLIGLIELQKEINAYQDGVSGFRVQLYRGNNMKTSHDEALSAKALFLEKYPDDVVYFEFQPPYWLVRVGDFKTYGEALKLRNKLEKELEEIKDDIYIVPTTVKINKSLSQANE